MGKTKGSHRHSSFPSYMLYSYARARATPDLRIRSLMSWAGAVMN